MSRKKDKNAILIILAITILTVSIVLILISIPKMISNHKENFEKVSKEATEILTEKMKEKFMTERHIDINISNIQKSEKLEVLNTYASCYIIKDGEKECRWVKFGGEGKYTIDMSKAQIWKNDAKNFICVCLPDPSLDDYKDVQLNDPITIMDYEKGIISGIVNGNVKDGFEDAINDQEEAQKKLKAKMDTRENREIAKEHGKKIIENLIKTTNPELKDDITIEIFYANEKYAQMASQTSMEKDSQNESIP